MALWEEQQRDAVSTFGEETPNWSLQQETSESLLEDDIERLSSGHHGSASHLAELERWASQHSTPSHKPLNRWTTSQLHDVASSLDRDLEKWAKINQSFYSGVDKWKSLNTDVSNVDRNIQKWMCKRPTAILNKERILHKWPVPYHDISVSLDRDLEKWEIQQRENAASLERDLEKWVGQCQQSALNRETDLEKWVSLHRKRTSHLEKEIDDWVDKRRNSIHLLEQEVNDSNYRRHSSVSLLGRELKKLPHSPHKGHRESTGTVATLPRRNLKRVMQKRHFKETSV